MLIPFSFLLWFPAELLARHSVFAPSTVPRQRLCRLSSSSFNVACRYDVAPAVADCFDVSTMAGLTVGAERWAATSRDRWFSKLATSTNRVPFFCVPVVNLTDTTSPRAIIVYNLPALTPYLFSTYFGRHHFGVITSLISFKLRYPLYSALSETRHYVNVVPDFYNPF